MASYQEQIAQLRQQRAAVEHQQQDEEIVQNYQQAVELRDLAAQTGDAAAWHIHDADCETLESDWARYYAPRPEQPKIDPQMARYLNSKKVFLDRHGTAAVKAMDLAHNYATRPRNPTTNNPDHTGMGLQAGSAQYYRAIDDLLEMYSSNN